jgi:hypothetical protein
MYGSVALSSSSPLWLPSCKCVPCSSPCPHSISVTRTERITHSGFPLALSENGQTILAVVVVLVAIVTASLLVWKWYSGRRQRGLILGETDMTSRLGPGRRKNGQPPHDTAMLPLRSHSTTGLSSREY